MSQKVFWFVTWDFMPGRTYLPIAEELLVRGHRVVVFAGGRSLPVWEKAVTRPRFSLCPINDTEVVVLEVRIAEMMAESKPDMLLVGCSSPIGVERVLALKANSLNIPLAVLPDTWGARMRLGDVRVNLLLAVDSLSRNIDGNADVIREVGDPLIEELYMMQEGIPDDISTFSKELAEEEKRTLLVVGQNPSYTPDVIRVAAECLRLTPDLMVIPKIMHPKKPDPGLLHAWTREMAGLQDRILNVPPEWNIDQIVMAADYVMSVFSTTLRISAFAHGTPISVTTPATIKGMMASTGLSTYPLVSLQFAFEISRGINLEKVKVKAADSYFEELRGAPKRAVSAIEEFLSV